MKLALLLLVASCARLIAEPAADSRIAANAVNALGTDLYQTQARGDGNLLLSPYSIQNALAMAYAGAEGDTRAEMRRTLHFLEDDEALQGSFGALAQELAELVKKSVERAKLNGPDGRPGTPIEFNLANRLFAQRGYEFRAPFLSLVKERYAAPLQEVDCQKEPEKVRADINSWVQGQTNNRIRDLIPAGGISTRTRLLLINAFYLRAPWTGRVATNERFLARGRDGIIVPTMLSQAPGGYARGNGLQIVTCHYLDQDLQLVIMIPDNPNGLAGVERLLTPKLLDGCTHLPERLVILHLPRFHLEPPTLPLSESLKALGMKTAFDDPPGSANFDRMAARKPDEYLALSAVLHKASITVDEKGAEAAAATGAPAFGALSAPVPKRVLPPVIVRVDHPFLFAIQHVPSGTCLFLGRVTDPR